MIRLNRSYGGDYDAGYDFEPGGDDRPRDTFMKRTLTQIRCVPRFGYAHTNVRLVELDGGAPDEPDLLLAILRRWFESRDILDAVFAIEHDDDGFFAVVNDEAYHQDWGEPLL